MSSTTSSSFGLPARRLTAVAATVAVTALAAAPAYATGAIGDPTALTRTITGDGTADAAVLRTALDVALLDKTVHVPLTASLNEVRAPGNASKTALGVTLAGVEQGRPVNLLRAEAATARATADGRAAQGYANLLRARVHVPGLPLLSLVEVQQVTSKAVCETGKKPVATSNLLGAVTVLGKKVTVSTAGTTKVTVPGVGEVRLDLSRTVTTSRTAAATALGLKVSINPLKLNVAEVEGQVTLARASCRTPKGPVDRSTPSGPAATPDHGGTDTKTQTGAEAKPVGHHLAETGGSSATPYVAGAAGLLVVAGGGTLIATRRRAAARRED
ncbi:SCO1860 family LAETG-anchored protein [Streptomyces syringium]|uniref:SCO1860 family LAETG-anchored protein n=1 Tax=Streptomyces syringium TaxID=76729 RepID=UPI0034374399